MSEFDNEEGRVVAGVTPALLAFLATPFADGPIGAHRFVTVDAAGPMVIDGFDYDDGWFVMARGRCARVAFEENDPYYPQGTWIVECDGVAEYISGCELDTVVLTVR